MAAFDNLGRRVQLAVGIATPVPAPPVPGGGDGAGEAVFSHFDVEVGGSPLYYMPVAAKLTKVVAGVVEGAAEITLYAGGNAVASLSPGSPVSATLSTELQGNDALQVVVTSHAPETTGLVVQVRYL